MGSQATVMRRTLLVKLKWVSLHDFKLPTGAGMPPEAMHRSATWLKRTSVTLVRVTGGSGLDNVPKHGESGGIFGGMP